MPAPKRLTPREALRQIIEQTSAFMRQNRKGFTNMGTALNTLDWIRNTARRTLRAKAKPVKKLDRSPRRK